MVVNTQVFRFLFGVQIWCFSILNLDSHLLMSYPQLFNFLYMHAHLHMHIQVNMETHAGYMGGLKREFCAKCTLPYYATSSEEVLFHVSTRMPPKLEQKVRDPCPTPPPAVSRLCIGYKLCDFKWFILRWRRNSCQQDYAMPHMVRVMGGGCFEWVRLVWPLDVSRGGAWLCLPLTSNAIFDLLLFRTRAQKYDF